MWNHLILPGVSACYRGYRVYDSDETKALVKKWVDFYKKYRDILTSDIVHVRRPDMQVKKTFWNLDTCWTIRGNFSFCTPGVETWNYSHNVAIVMEDTPSLSARIENWNQYQWCEFETKTELASPASCDGWQSLTYLLLSSCIWKHRCAAHANLRRDFLLNCRESTATCMWTRSSATRDLPWYSTQLWTEWPGTWRCHCTTRGSQI